MVFCPLSAFLMMSKTLEGAEVVVVEEEALHWNSEVSFVTNAARNAAHLVSCSSL